MSKRQDIIDALETRMKTILTTGGYQTNVGQRVETWYVNAVPDTWPDALIIFDRDETVNMEVSTLDTYFYDLVVDIVIDCKGSTSRELLRAARNDVRSAVDTDRTWSSLALMTRFENSDMNLEQGEKLTGGFLHRLRITYQE